MLGVRGTVYICINIYDNQSGKKSLRTHIHCLFLDAYIPLLHLLQWYDILQKSFNTELCYNKGGIAGNEDPPLILFLCQGLQITTLC